MSCNLQAGCTDALCQVSVRLVSLCSYIINRAYLHTKLSNFNPGALFLYERLPLKVISAVLSGVVRLTGYMSERHRFKGALKQWNHTQRKATEKEKVCRIRQKIRPTGGGHIRGDGRRGARLLRPHPSDAARFFKGDSHSSTEGIPF